MKLSDKACKTAKARESAYKLTDGGGMYLEISPNGSKYWRMKYRFNGKENRMSFGTYPEVSLKEARDKRSEAKKILDCGQNPNEQKKLAKLERKTQYENNFENIAREWHKEKYEMWKPEHAERILKRFESDVFPMIGRRPMRDIRPAEVLQAIKKVEARGVGDTAHRLMQMCGQVFRYAVATDRAERDVTADLKGALKPVKSEGLAYLREEELPGFLKELDQYEIKYGGHSLTRLAFKLLILTFVRSSEIREAKWDEFDFDKALWRIPAERMKMNEQHLVPLSTQSLALLKEIYKETGGKVGNLVFPSRQSLLRTMSENTFLRAIKNMGYKGKTTGHGFRSTASTILNENGFRADVIERQLAHGERDQIRGAYNHAEYLLERKQMMQWWGDYLDKAKL